MKRDLTALAPERVRGLRTLLERAELPAHYSEAARICADLGVTKLDDLQYEGVWRELSNSLRLNFVETAKLRAQCADEAKLRAYANADSSSLQGDEARDQRRRLSTLPIVSPPTQASLMAADAGSAGGAGPSQSRAASSSSDSIVSSIVTITMEGHIADFDREACKATLAQRLQMKNQHFKVTHVKARGGRAPHEVTLDSGSRIWVDIDVSPHGLELWATWHL
jgi:hypothetical protein